MTLETPTGWNVTPNFFSMMTTTGNPGGCWVSKNCYEPKALLTGPLGALANRYRGNGQLVVLKNTVIKRVVVDGGNIERVVAVQRTPKAGVGWGGYDRLPSEDLNDWYEERASARYDKQVIELSSGYDRPAVFIDATDWGELLALSGAAYVQGVESSEGAQSADETCGQSIVFPFVEKLNGAAVADMSVPEATESRRLSIHSRQAQVRASQRSGTRSSATGAFAARPRPPRRETCLCRTGTRATTTRSATSSCRSQRPQRSARTGAEVST